MPLSTENQEKTKSVVVVNTGMKKKRVRIPERIKDISLKWLREAPFFSEFLLRFHYFYTEDIQTMGVNSTRGKINLFINEEFMNGGGEFPKFDDEGKPILIKDEKGDPLLDDKGNVQYEMEEWKGLTDPQLEGVVVHEIMHLVRLHHDRMKDKNAPVWNIAGDMIINEELLKTKIGSRMMELPDGCVYLKDAIDDGYNDKAITESVYYWLIDKQKEYMDMMKDLIQSQSSGSSSMSCPSCGGDGQEKKETGNACPSCGGDGQEKDEEGNPTGDTCSQCGGDGKEKQETGNACPSCGGNGKQKGSSGDDLFDAKYGSKIDNHDLLAESDDAAESAIKEVVQNGKVRGWGNVSGNMISVLEELTKPSKIPWKQLLRKSLASYIYSHGDIYENNWSRRNRRSLPLPGTRKLSRRVIVGVDTSGSICQEELKQFFSEIEKIVKECSMLKIYQWDTSVKSVWNSYKKGDWKRIEVKGRGGTDVQDVFDRVANDGHKNDIFINFTDGYFNYDFETHGIKTIWCLTEDTDPPHGKQIRVEIEEN